MGGEALCATWSDSSELTGTLGAVRVFELEELGTPFCFCPQGAPCGNVDAIRGCDNARGQGARLHAAGSASVSADDLRFATLIFPSGQSGVLFMGTQAIEVPFGNGLRCIGGTVIRLGTKLNVGNTSSYPTGADPSVSVKGMLPAAGGTRLYQIWYRNAAAFCTPSTFNLSNAITITWTP